jgi:hypothetical protein
VSPAEVRELARREVAVKVEVAAEILGVPRSSVYPAIHAGIFPVPVIRVTARRWIVPTQALLEVLRLDAAAPREEARLRVVP